MRIATAAVAIFVEIICISPRAYATATAFAEAQWDFVFPGDLPAGIEMACPGSAFGSHACFDSQSVSVGLDLPGHKSQSLISDGFVRIRNTGIDTIGLNFIADWADDNPGGLGIQATVTDPRFEVASFESEVSGPSPINSMHSCETNILNPSCGIPAPDLSHDEIFEQVPANGEVDLPFHIALNVSVTIIPEPANMTILGWALVLFVARIGRCRNRT